jgi:hypothetical protein
MWFIRSPPEEHITSIFRVKEYTKQAINKKQVASRALCQPPASCWLPAWLVTVINVTELHSVFHLRMKRQTDYFLSFTTCFTETFHEVAYCQFIVKWRIQKKETEMKSGSTHNAVMFNNEYTFHLRNAHVHISAVQT